jgi:hypothetical protein
MPGQFREDSAGFTGRAGRPYGIVRIGSGRRAAAAELFQNPQTEVTLEQQSPYSKHAWSQ